MSRTLANKSHCWTLPRLRPQQLPMQARCQDVVPAAAGATDSSNEHEADHEGATDRASDGNARRQSSVGHPPPHFTSESC